MLKTDYDLLKKDLPHLKKDVSLADCTTFKIGGRARYFLSVNNPEEMTRAALSAKKCRLPLLILGGGSNLLISEKGWPGIAIKNQIAKIQLLKKDVLFGGAGANLSRVVKASADNSLKGLEWAAGIPGTLGGAIVGNAGAFGSSMQTVVKSVEALDLKTGEIRTFSRKDCLFGYRNSIFKKNKNLIVLAGHLQLKQGDKEEIKKKIQEYLAYRHARHPKEPSAGSIFKNVDLSGLEKDFFNRFPDSRKLVRDNQLPSAYLIDQAGLKGRTMGGAKVSELHSNFIINTGKATSQDVKSLIKAVKKQVKEKFGVAIEEEIIFL